MVAAADGERKLALAPERRADVAVAVDDIAGPACSAQPSRESSTPTSARSGRQPTACSVPGGRFSAYGMASGAFTRSAGNRVGA